MKPTVAETGDRWRDAWPDALAFVVGLGVAWFASWNTADLVWSLWLSSLVVGYSILVWQLSAVLREFAVNAARDRSPGAGWMKAGGFGVVLFGTLFGLVFFTVHFGGFHFGHSVFLSHFFPIETEGGSAHRGFPNAAVYAEVFRRYWIFLPAAFLAQRAGFVAAGSSAQAKRPSDVAVRKPVLATGALVAPYSNVVRMHLLIFFFAAAHVVHLDHFIVYAVVYAVYFFPWRLVRRSRTTEQPTQA